jgi:hypothetical protein
VKYSFIIATQNTGKKTGKMGVLFFCEFPKVNRFNCSAVITAFYITIFLFFQKMFLDSLLPKNCKRPVAEYAPLSDMQP